MFAIRIIDVFSAGSPACEEIAELVESMACPQCRVVVKDVREPEVAAEAARLGLDELPAVVVDEGCCAGHAVDPSAVRPDPDG
jgi:glutaredoxin 3